MSDVKNRGQGVHRDPFGDQEKLHKEGYRPAGICEGHKLACRIVACVNNLPLTHSFDSPQESQVTLYNLPDLSNPTPLPKAKSAFSFAVHTSVQHLNPDGRKIRPQDTEFASPTIPVPTVITCLVVGCQRKLVVYSWKDGEAQDIKVRRIG